MPRTAVAVTDVPALFNREAVTNLVREDIGEPENPLQLRYLRRLCLYGKAVTEESMQIGKKGIGKHRGLLHIQWLFKTYAGGQTA